MKERELQTHLLSALEISGAICPRILHDLSNLISGIVGNAEYAERMTDNPAGLQKALRAISLSASSAGKLLGQCLPLQTLVARESFPYETREQACLIAEAGAANPDWRVAMPPELAGRILVQPRWLAGAVWQIVRETGAPRGEIEFVSGPAVFPVVWRGPSSSVGQPPDLFHIVFRFRSEQVLFPNAGPVTPERPGLLAACELIRHFKGQLHGRPKPPGRQEISVLLPLI